jgi:hypothetical protein
LPQSISSRRNATHSVALLALLDTGATGMLLWTVYAQYLRDHGLSNVQQWCERWKRERISYLRGRWRALRFWIDQNRPKPPAVIAPPTPGSQPPQVPGFDDYYVAVASACRLRRYPGSVDVFACAESGPHWCWKYLARGGMSVHPIAGKHNEILGSDYVPAVAKALRRRFSARTRTWEHLGAHRPNTSVIP